MPELPEVETMRRGVACVVGSRVADLVRPRCRYRPITLSPAFSRIKRRVVGRRILEVGRIGKRLLLRLDGGDRIVFEPRMTGLLLLADPPDLGHLRLRLRLEEGTTGELLFWDRRGLGTVRLYTAMEFATRLGPPYLGPDALEATTKILRHRLGSSRRAIKVALMDQQRIAGIGNLYASEILHAARLHPARPCDRLTPDQWRRLHSSMRRILRAAIQYEGSTLADGTYRNALNEAGRYQNHHRVYQRADKVCLRCGRARIERIVQAQRSTFYCPVCQRRS